MWDPIEQTLSTFGEERLIRANPDAVRKLKIPEKSKAFLIDVGLPKERILLCEFYLDSDEYPTIQEYARECGSDIEADLQLRRIGYDGGRHICISEENTSGEVLVIDLKGELPTAFVNMSVETFAGFLALYVEACHVYADLTETEMIDGARKFERQLRELDPLAFQNTDTWWSSITEQLKSGML